MASSRVRPSSLCAVLLLALNAAGATGQDSIPTPAPARGSTADTVQAPVVLAGDTLFRLRAGQGPFSAADRARAVAGRIRDASRELTEPAPTVDVVEGERTFDVRIGGRVIVSVTEQDARAAGMEPRALADSLSRILEAGFLEEAESAELRSVLLGALWTLLATGVLVSALFGLGAFFPKVYRLLRMWKGKRIPSIRIQRLVLVSAEQLTRALIRAARGLRLVLTLALFFFYIPLVFSFFPWTRDLSSRFVEYLLDPLRLVGRALVGYMPSLFFIVVIAAVTYYALRVVRMIFSALGRGTITLPGFYPDWAQPTFKILRLLVVAFAVIVVWPYLPRSDSAAFKGVAAFLGLLLTFGSASAISNVVGGVVLIYMRPFQVGDRVRISSTEGEVIEKTLLVTRVRTPKNVEITMPNAMVLGSHITNFSAMAEDAEPLILHTGVTIGYETPWRTVHELLVSAARGTEGVLAEPAPFVLQTALGDFYVSYELNAYTDRPREMPRVYSEIHQRIQDAFADAGVEITSPHFRAVRAGEASTVPHRGPEGGDPDPAATAS